MKAPTQLQHEIDEALDKKASPSLSAGLTAGSTLMLGPRAFVVMRIGKHGADLRGLRGGGYALVQNVKDPSLWSLIPSGQLKPRAVWYRQQADGNFESIR